MKYGRDNKLHILVVKYNYVLKHCPFLIYYLEQIYLIKVKYLTTTIFTIQRS